MSTSPASAPAPTPEPTTVSLTKGRPPGWVMPGRVLDGTHYILSGPSDGPLVVCIHGIGSYFITYDGFPELAEAAGFRVLRYDLLGRGFSGPPADDDYGAKSHIEQLHSLLVKLGLNTKPYHVIGHSMGGALAALYVHAYPTEVVSAVFLAPAGLMDLHHVRLLRGLPRFFQGIVCSVLRSGQEKAYRNDFHKHGTEAEELLVSRLRLAHANNPTQHHAFFQCVVQFPLTGIHTQVKSIADRDTPVLVLWGDKDIAVPYKPNYDRWQAIMKDDSSAEFVVYEDTGHGIGQERPEAWGRIVEFLTKHKTDAPIASRT